MENLFHDDTKEHLRKLYFGTKQYLESNLEKNIKFYEIPKSEEYFNVFLWKYKIQILEGLGYDTQKMKIKDIKGYIV